MTAAQNETSGGAPTPYEAMGGRETFQRLVHLFYQGVAGDELLRPMYPEEDLGPAEDRLRMFLEQYWGGPSDYHEQRGHPRLRIRHAQFRVTQAAAERWLVHMLGAVDQLDLAPEYDAAMREYLTRAAQFLVNTTDDQPIRRELPLA
ncbi:globin [Aestuariimicrobium kwangyangense]|uniref:globin n=1 Tax=Aestuariimicrobium kwangyangense TaxID=396389 RepID=UPI0003B5C148|nr:globin [Aestuariimicrobium kwangyangense]